MGIIGHILGRCWGHVQEQVPTEHVGGGGWVFTPCLTVTKTPPTLYRAGGPSHCQVLGVVYMYIGVLADIQLLLCFVRTEPWSQAAVSVLMLVIKHTQGCL